jgi:hypothetical protein
MVDDRPGLGAEPGLRLELQILEVFEAKLVQAMLLGLRRILFVSQGCGMQ